VADARPTSASVEGLRAWARTDRPAASLVVVGVVNVTPDSFSDGGRYVDPSAAIAHVDRLLAEGADVVEIGGESTRPAGADYGAGHAVVTPEVQLARVVPVLRHAVVAAAACGARVAIDTASPVVARAALTEGATIVNDVSCLADPELARVTAEAAGWFVLMHARPGATSAYRDVVADVVAEWSAARDRAVAAGLRRERIVFDPGLGFGKAPADSLRLLAALPSLRALGHPIYVGASRKGLLAFAEERAGLPRSAPAARDPGTVAVTSYVRAHAHAVRVHDVHGTRQALAVLDALAAAEPADPGEHG